MSSRRGLPRCTFAAALLLLAACGGDDTTAEAQPPTTDPGSTPSTALVTTSTTSAPTTTADPSALRCAATVTGDISHEYVANDRIVTRERGPEETIAFLTLVCGTIGQPDLRLAFELLSETSAGFPTGPQHYLIAGRPDEGTEPGVARASLGISGDAFRPVDGDLAFTRLEDAGYQGTFHIEAEQVVGPGVVTPKHIVVDGTFDFPCADPTSIACT